MNIKYNVIEVPEDMDKECVQLFEFLNNLPTVETYESCCGHYKNVYSFWFHCESIGVLSRIGRAIERNYSDGKWELLVDSNDVNPHGDFWLKTKEPFKTEEEMKASVSSLIGNIKYWFDDKFDEHFDGCECNWHCSELQDGEPGTFGQAIESLKKGKLVARTGWNGKGMFLFMRPGDKLDDKFIVNNVKSLPISVKMYINNKSSFDSSTIFTPYICMKAADDTIVNGWLASQTDMLSEDWVLVK